MTLKKYLVLVSANQQTASLAQRVQRNILTIDPHAKAAWIDARGAGLFILSTLSAVEVARKAMDGLNSVQSDSLRDLAVLELGHDHWSHQDSQISAWMNARRP